MVDRVTLGLAGAGWMAGVHAAAASHVPGLRITRVASRRPERAQATAQRCGATAVPYAELAEGVDGVVVSSPPAQHAEQALAAARSGAGVLVEKPLCATLDDADRLVAAADAGAVVAYAENLLHAPAVVLALRQRQELGPLQALEVRALQPRPGWGDFLTLGWGGGALFDLGAHPLAVALALAAPARPVEVRARLEGAVDHPVDEHAEVDIAFDSGLIGHVVASWRHPDGALWDAQAASADGVVRLELLPDVQVERNGAVVALPPLPEGVPPQLEELGYLPQIESFALDLLRGRRPQVDVRLGRDVLDLTCAAYWSAPFQNAPGDIECLIDVFL
ncbi:MAG: Gfo/Idh/MocA family protein [Actinomycetota bacterium]